MQIDLLDWRRCEELLQNFLFFNCGRGAIELPVNIVSIVCDMKSEYLEMQLRLSSRFRASRIRKTSLVLGRGGSHLPVQLLRLLRY